MGNENRSESDETPGAIDYFKSWLLYPLPHHLISALVYKLTRVRALGPIVIRAFIRLYRVDMSQAKVQNINEFDHFNDFFTRELAPSARPVDTQTNGVACPADGTISALGNISGDQIFQAKGHDYSLVELLGGDTLATDTFKNGRFMTVYLSPRDYHRLHMPLTGSLYRQTHVPGRLFSVAPHTVKTVPRLFARNERVVSLFNTDYGHMALVLVGAINVSSIETVWAGQITPPGGKQITTTDYTGRTSLTLVKGEEMGRFNMGSTIIVLLESGIRWSPGLATGSTVKMGESIGTAD